MRRNPPRRASLTTGRGPGDSGARPMPLVKYFLVVGGLLVALLFVANRALTPGPEQAKARDPKALAGFVGAAHPQAEAVPARGAHAASVAEAPPQAQHSEPTALPKAESDSVRPAKASEEARGAMASQVAPEPKSKSRSARARRHRHRSERSAGYGDESRNRDDRAYRGERAFRSWGYAPYGAPRPPFFMERY